MGVITVFARIAELETYGNKERREIDETFNGLDAQT
jgi:hypothetical protein